jgi:hypothetical protein
MTSAQRHGGAAVIYSVGVNSTKTRMIFIFSKIHAKHTRW